MPITIEKRTITPRQKLQAKRPKTREEQMIDSLSPNLNIMVNAVRKAGAGMVRDFGEVSSLQVSQKGPGDFVSNADLMAEKNLISYLKEARPDYAFVSEECGELKPEHGSKMCWIIDPIDGTTNFLHAIPIFAISVALMDAGEVIAGVIYNPITNELYYAEKGQGAFVMTPTGNRRLRVSGRRKLSYSVLGSNGFGLVENRNMVARIGEKMASVRFNGCTTLSMAAVAAGQLEVYIASQFKIWDIAAGYLLIKEAGGFVSDFHADRDIHAIVRSHGILATNMGLRDAMLKLVEEK